MRRRVRAVGAGEFRLQGAKAAAILAAAPVWSYYQTIFLFLSTDREADTLPLLEIALEQGKKVFAPLADFGSPAFCRIFSPDGPWQKGAFGIPQPAASAGYLLPQAEDFPALIIAPGLAFDCEGRRLGRGAGFYDRYFAKLDEERKEYLALGFCMDFQIAAGVPADGRDKKVGGILSAAGLIFCPQAKLA
ncbi:MAG: 5-formyltetrahydrofolate cyclo-ligase [Treponema sp.]|nr:5-formyltetrahydrofolate cyclo-ligase [Treponema sp.]